MIRIFDITVNDLLQLLRDLKIFLFLLIMPILFTFLFGYAFGGFGGISDPRLPVEYLDLDNSHLSQQLEKLLQGSDVIRLQQSGIQSRLGLEALVADEKLAAAILVPAGWGHETLREHPTRLVFIGDSSSTVGMSVESEVLSRVTRLKSALQIAMILENLLGERVSFDFVIEQALESWQEPPIRIIETTSSAILDVDRAAANMANTSPGVMLQFAIAGLLTSAQIMVNERKTRALQRILTTATQRVHILLGHYLTIFSMIFCQLILLIIFGQIVLKVNYMNSPLATLLLTFCACLCIAALGLLIGILAKNEDQAVIFSLIPMFVLAGLGGAWVPLEYTGEIFQVVGHASPLAWAMDGFKNITIRGLGLESVVVPSLALVGYAGLFFVLSVWRFRRLELI